MGKSNKSAEGKISITNVEFKNLKTFLQFVDDVSEGKLTQKALADKYDIDDKNPYAKTGNVKRMVERIILEILNKNK
jgi:hypothetical protein